MAKKKQKSDTTITPGSGNIFIDVGFSPRDAKMLLELAEAADRLKQAAVQAVKVLGIKPRKEHTHS